MGLFRSNCGLRTICDFFLQNEATSWTFWHPRSLARRALTCARSCQPHYSVQAGNGPSREVRHIMDRDAIRYGERPGTDPQTGRPCLPVTAGIVERIEAYNRGTRPQRIIAGVGPFFGSVTGNPIAWYYKNDKGDIELFNLMGFHPVVGDELKPVTRDVVAEWQKQASRRVAQLVKDPEEYGWFDPLNGAPRVCTTERTTVRTTSLTHGPGYRAIAEFW